MDVSCSMCARTASPRYRVESIGLWKHIVEDTREYVHKIMSKNLDCK